MVMVLMVMGGEGVHNLLECLESYLRNFAQEHEFSWKRYEIKLTPNILLHIENGSF